MTERRARFDERSFHAWLARRLPAGRAGPLPLGDDAAALRPPPGRLAIVSTDALVEGTHFLSNSPARAIGAAATGVNLSDLAAKGAEPAGVLLALLLPPGTPRRWAEEVVGGAERAARRAGIHVVGGDTKAAPVRAVVGTAIGWADRRHLAPRSGARPGDLLLTTGYTGRGGWAAAGRPGERGSLRAMLEVTPRIAAGRALAVHAHAMLDTSDGIAEAARLLAGASRVRVRVDEAALPLWPALRPLPPARRRTLAFFGGDYELLASVPRARIGAAVRSVGATGLRLTVVGRVDRGRGAWLANRSRTLPMPGAGWDPFRRPRPRSR
jgi:thiamine-monophosphate kinase